MDTEEDDGDGADGREEPPGEKRGDNRDLRTHHARVTFTSRLGNGQSGLGSGVECKVGSKDRGVSGAEVAPIFSKSSGVLTASGRHRCCTALTASFGNTQ